MMADTPDQRLGTEIAGYRIEERLGRGGMGVVYRAQHMNLRRRAAVKIIVPELADAKGFRTRFIREARIAAALQHPNIVTVYDAGQVDGTLYIAMQFIRGSDLAATLREEGRLRPYRAIDVCRQVGSALDAAHAMGLIHRDVKPANVLLEGRRAYLTDFGLTKRSGSTKTALTKAGELVGTIHYVAPEQIEGAQVDARTDVYSLGCLLFHCLVGEVPFERDNDVAVIYAHLSEPPPKVTDVRPELPAGLDAVLAKALDKSPDRRFQTCGDLMSAARVVIDAAGPLADSISGRGVPLGGDAPEVTTSVGRGVPGAGDAESVGTLTGVTVPERRSRMLLVGVDPRTRAIVRVAVGDRCEIDEAPSGEDVLEIARDRRPDLVLIDWNAPDLASREVLEALRADAVMRESKVLLVVHDKQTRSHEVASAGADETLGTPFSPLQLQVKLRKLLGADAVAR
jgi:tRNA A-37 threonylcarbamoyl transferase component Bud32/CheY-like chemotaxis protein